MPDILVIEDDELQRKAVVSYLIRKGFNAIGVEGPNAAYDELYERKFDLIITDIMMKPVDGFDFAAAVREDDKNIPIIFISARSDLPAKAKGFSLGIDDYVVKPFELEELEFRINALLRRAGIEKSHHLEIGNMTIDLDEYSAAINGEEIHLTKREFGILYKLLSMPKKVFSRGQLFEEFWGDDSYSSSRSVDILISRLREKITAADSFEIQTVHGLGYKAVIKE